MRYLLLTAFIVMLLSPVIEPAMAQGSGSGGFCLRIDEKENCAFSTMADCNSAAMSMGGYCAENFRLYGSKGSKRYCLATRYGTSCVYNDRRRCINAAGARGEEGAACVDNYALTETERRRLEERGASDCEPTDFACQAGL